MQSVQIVLNASKPAVRHSGSIVIHWITLISSLTHIMCLVSPPMCRTWARAMKLIVHGLWSIWPRTRGRKRQRKWCYIAIFRHVPDYSQISLTKKKTSGLFFFHPWAPLMNSDEILQIFIILKAFLNTFLQILHEFWWNFTVCNIHWEFIILGEFCIL